MDRAEGSSGARLEQWARGASVECLSRWMISSALSRACAFQTSNAVHDASYAIAWRGVSDSPECAGQAIPSGGR